MEDEKAAQKIQSLYRGHAVRKKKQTEHESATKIQKVYRGHRTRKEHKIVKASAVKIQKVFRGHLERKRLIKSRPKVVEFEDEEGTIEQTLAIIKPNAVADGNVGAIKRMIAQAGFHIVTEKKILLSRTSAEEFYAEHAGKPFYTRLTEFMSSGPVVVMVLARVNAITAWRKLMGPTNVTTAKQQQPQSIRALYGNEKESTHNASHGSDSPTSAQREILFFFPTLKLYTMPTNETAQEYVNHNIMPVLTEGLANLCKQKPADPILWLASWLLSNNPNKPRVSEPV